MNQLPPTPPDDDGKNDAPKFGRLLILLLFGVAMVVAITFGSEAYFTNAAQTAPAR